jgi:REP element-mobilizing transposase RayT
VDGEPPSQRRWARRRLAAFDYASRDLAYFVTIRAREGTSPFTDDRLAQEVLASLNWLRAHRGVKLYAHCLMPDHLHLLLRLGDGYANLGVMVGAMKSFTTKRSWELGYRGQLWQPRFYDHVVREGDDAEAIAVYIVNNPVRKGLVEEARDYPYSGYLDPL